MQCECGVPICPPNILIRYGLFREKEIPNNYIDICPICGATHLLTSYKGKVTLNK